MSSVGAAPLNIRAGFRSSSKGRPGQRVLGVLFVVGVARYRRRMTNNIAKHRTDTDAFPHQDVNPPALPDTAAPAPPVQWWAGPKMGFDCESTGVDTALDRIVSASLVPYPCKSPAAWEWLADPGVEIPADAAQIHGITTDFARSHGRPAGEVVNEICSTLEEHWTWGENEHDAVPLVGFNVHYDLSLLDAEARRHLGRPLTVRGPVIDPRILDMQVDWHRTGKRNLGAVCEHYDVPLSKQDAHTSSGDALAALRIVDHLAEREHATLGHYTVAELHAEQARWWQAQNAAKAAEFEQKAQQLAERARQARLHASDSWPITGRL